MKKWLRPEAENPLTIIGIILNAAAFFIHMALISGYPIPDWIAIAAVLFYPLGLFMIISQGKKQKK